MNNRISGCPAPLAASRLTPHATTPSAAVRAIDVRVTPAAEAGEFAIRYVVHGAVDEILVPGPAAPERTDSLWRHTCFELFALDGDGPRYVEYNFSPSGAWAAYGFTARRAGMHDLPLDAPPRISMSVSATTLTLDVIVELPPGLHARRLGLTAVLEERGGALSYWALAHGAARPDFHDPAGFALAMA